MDFNNHISELKRRRVFRVAGMYIVAGVATMQAVDVLFRALVPRHADDYTMFVVVALLIGFPVAVALAWFFDVARDRGPRVTAGSSATATADSPPALAGTLTSRGTAVAYLGVGILVALVGFGGVWKIQSVQERSAVSSLAVLPFADLSRDGNQRYFSAGVAEELLTALSKVEGLRVAGRTSSFAVSEADAAKQLNVEAILTGSVRRDGNRLRITARLINATTGYEIWSDVYERDATDVFAVQAEIARSITERIRLHAGTEGVAAERAGLGRLKSHDLYLQGLARWNLRSERDLRAALAAFEGAVTADSTFAPAWAGVALTYAVLPMYAETPIPDARARGMAAADRALALQPDMAEAHAARSQIALNLDWDTETAIAEAERAVALNGNYATAHQWLSEAYSLAGRLDDARTHIDAALALDPLSPAALNVSANQHVRSGSIARGLQEQERAIALSGRSRLFLGSIALNYAMAGRFDEAEKAWSEYSGQPEVAGVLYNGIRVASKSSRSPGEEQAYRAAIALVDTAHESLGSTGAALGYVMLHENEKAITAYERAADEHTFLYLPSLLSSSVNAQLFGNPRFQQLLQRVNATLSSSEIARHT